MDKINIIKNCIFKDRHDFNIEALENIKGNREFIFNILPYVARSFSLSIVVLPNKLAIPTALGYCYCRILDTFEDMLFDPIMREKALKQFPYILKNLMDGKKADISKILYFEKHLTKTKKKDETYCLLVREIKRINDVFSEQDSAVQNMIYILVKKMAKGMVKNTGTFKENDDKITKSAIKRYCKSVLGYPLIFLCQLISWSRGNEDYLNIVYKKEIIEISQFIQLANITRDIEEDLVNNVVYHNLLISYKWREERKDLTNPILKEKISRVRKELMIDALASAAVYMKVMKKYFMDIFPIRLSMLLFLRFTENFYKNLAHKYYSLHDKCSNYYMIFKCIIISLFELTTRFAVENSMYELKNLKKLLLSQYK